MWIHEGHVPSLVLHILSSISAIESKLVTWVKIIGLHLRVDVASLPQPYANHGAGIFTYTTGSWVILFG